MNTPDDPRPNEWVLPPDEPAAAPAPPKAPVLRRPLPRVAVPVASVVAAFVVGAAAVYGFQHLHGGTAGASSPASAARAGQGPLGANGYGYGAPRGGGGVAGEQYVQGTITAKTSSSVTVKSASGSATYSVNASSEVVRNGQAATLSAVRVGDRAFLHVYPSASGQMLVERLFAGTTSAPRGPNDGGGQSFGPAT